MDSTTISPVPGISTDAPNFEELQLLSPSSSSSGQKVLRPGSTPRRKRLCTTNVWCKGHRQAWNDVHPRGKHVSLWFLGISWIMTLCALLGATLPFSVLSRD
ncbi:hypothetical protein P153DRAFT_121511 [Dothidotthia symphoricarpi CBS 119687]|uniref:Uncharacterized protein n=1 Tax=Dothidotthia symphoricarpi CBS 119687 TaxID=1392245 RepID=A0A6A5ZZI2_9PLEO|nr:uncharacterized protein P153DRAFT_121511 [Dothidotthia symphoricarpi CBS 119687]KAF2125152.1 hypothetical protein P153DRAFT_121511 [Dothidotthia symphoricarpi CBS 119687]